MKIARNIQQISGSSREHISKMKKTKQKIRKTMEKMAKINGALLCEYLLGWRKDGSEKHSIHGCSWTRETCIKAND